ncbi:MAG: phosphatidate cytidylyltransferase [Salinarimonas sp.]
MPPPAPRGDERGFLRSETGIRLLSALVLVALALGSAWAGGWATGLFWLLAASAAAHEWMDVTKPERREPLWAATFMGLIAVAVSVMIEAPQAALMWLVVFPAAILLFGRRGRDRGWGLVGFAVVVILATAPVLVRESPVLGLTGLLWIFAVVWGTDIAAYFTGRALGGPKLAPRISPGKTWSGFFGGLVAGTLAGTFVAMVGTLAGWERPLPWAALVALAAVASVVGQIGDLAESALKRHFKVKDSSRLIPGHGGVLDRIDAFVAVCAFVLLGLGLSTVAG